MVDDDRQLADTMADILHYEGYSTWSVATIDEARECMAIWPPDLLICDIRLDVACEGYDFALELRAAPETAQLPIILMSGWMLLGDIELAPPFAKLGKPFDSARLAELAERLTTR
ncbi:MAG: response regulator [Chloroflexota bacterium]